MRAAHTQQLCLLKITDGKRSKALRKRNYTRDTIGEWEARGVRLKNTLLPFLPPVKAILKSKQD